MLEARKSALADADLVDIWWHGFLHWGEAQADRYVEQIEQEIERLRRLPHMGLSVDDLWTDCRRWSVGVHHVYYLVEQDHLLIVRVLSVRQNPSRHLEA